MRFASLSILVFFLAGCRGELAAESALRVSVHYKSWRPACLRVIASDGTNKAETTVMPPVTPDDTAVIGVYRGEGWQTQVSVTVVAYEQRCDGKELFRDVHTKQLVRGQAVPDDYTITLVDEDGDGFVPQSLGGTDCDDKAGDVHPGASEVCNGRDDNCDGRSDEGFEVSAACGTPGCDGHYLCAPDGGRACDAPLPTPWYTDDDGDGDGNPVTRVLSCARPDAGYLPDGGDCDDGDPFTASTRPEICDGRDNNCDGRVDEGGVCPGGGAWTVRVPGSPNEDFHTVALWGDGGVWVAGAQDSLYQKVPDGGTFTAAGPCIGGTTWSSAWADPITGRVYLGGSGGRIAQRNPGDAGTCTPLPSLPTSRIVGGVGFQLPDGGVDVFVVGDDGKSFRINSTSFVAPPQVPGKLAAAHGLSPELLFAVGDDGKAQPAARIYRFNPDGGTWQQESVTAPSALSAVQVVNPRLAYAVGSNGTVLQWNGGGWTPVPYPNGGGLLRSVLAFGRSNVYVSDDNTVVRFDGGTWHTEFTLTTSTNAGLPVWDLAGGSPADLWGAGSAGRVFHWPD